VRTPVKAAAGAVAVAHAGDDSDLAGSGMLTAGADERGEAAAERGEAEVHPAQLTATAMAPAADMPAISKAARMRA
jgi:hypothetical protein